MTFDGPTGYGVRGKAVGCQTFVDKIKGNGWDGEAKKLREAFDVLEGSTKGQEKEEDKSTSIMDKLGELIYKMSYACEHSECVLFVSSLMVN